MGACAPDSSASGGHTSADTASFVDAAGRVHRPSRPAERIVSLVPSATLTLHALGADGALVGRTDYDTASWATSLPSVGGGVLPSQEALLALQPDLVIHFHGDQDTRTPALLDRLGVPRLAVRPDRVSDVLDIVRWLGRVTGRRDRGEALADSIQARLAAVRARAAPFEPVKVAYVLGGTPPWVAGPGTYVEELLETAGGLNVFDDLDRLYAPVAPEEFLARSMDLILVPRREALSERLQAGRPVVVVGDLLELPGPGVADAAERLLAILHPDSPS